MMNYLLSVMQMKSFFRTLMKQQPLMNVEEESDVNVLRDSIVDGLMVMWQ
jgi:hypothetical protein